VATPGLEVEVSATIANAGPGPMTRAVGLVVDGQPVPAPYTLTVIGPSSTMKTALMIPGGVADSVARDGGTLLVDEATQVRVDALHPAEDLQYAQPVR